MTNQAFKAMIVVLKRFTRLGYKLSDMKIYLNRDNNGIVNGFTIDISFMDYYDTDYGDSIPFHNCNSYTYNFNGVEFIESV